MYKRQIIMPPPKRFCGSKNANVFYAFFGSITGIALAGTVLGLRGGIGKVNWDIFAGWPISKPKRFKTNPLTTGFQMNIYY